MNESAHQLGDAAIDIAYEVKMRALARTLDRVLNDDKTGDARDAGFVLLVFPFVDHEGRCNYISNANRDDVVIMLREQLARFEGRAGEPGRA
jgi:hypothetical protein